MTVTDLIGWAGFALVLSQSYLLGSQNPRYRAYGFVVGIASAFCWGWSSIASELWPLLALNVVLMPIMIRGLYFNIRSSREN